ncbi:hypothetical protein [Chryseobacterium sp. SIMBA_038]|uniref:hypothetical protein n=1 Tax=Chryseobacterium sp. SIMBA_038 TaxID=3085780 RepID=UPI003977E592
MSNFLLFCKLTRVLLKFRFLTYKFRLLKFLGKFSSYFKQMYFNYINEKKLLDAFNLILNNYLKESDIYKNCKINCFDIVEKTIVTKSLIIQYDVKLENNDFYILMICKKSKFNFKFTLHSMNKDYSKIILGENDLFLIFGLIKYLNEINQIPLLKYFMSFDEFFEKK